MKITTKLGDNQTSTLDSPERIKKNDCRFVCLGDYDELNSYLGVIKACFTDNNNKQLLEKIQANIFQISAHIYDAKNKDYILSEDEIIYLEEIIEQFSKNNEGSKFVFSGVNLVSAHIHVARTIARRAERSLALVSESNYVCDEAKKYSNRLSDFLFVLAKIHEKEV